MAEMLASDLNNPAFVNPLNPDSLLHVEFYWHEPEDVHKSQEAAKLVRGEKQPYVQIQKPGDTTTIIQVAVREDHKRRWPEKWLYWQMKEGLIDGAHDIPGWKVEEWKELSPEQVHELKYLRFHTVEQIAGASDAQVQRMGMSGLGLREKARIALRERMGAETRDALEAKEKELADIKGDMQKLQEQMAQLIAAQTKAAPAPTVEAEREALVAQYEERFGKKPHHRANVETIREELNG